MSKTPIATVTTTINAPASKVWDALTKPDQIKQYLFGTDVTTDWKVGSPITFRGEFNGHKYEDKGVIKTVQPEKKLSFTHWSSLSKMPDKPENYHIVTFDLVPAGKGTEVTLTQENQNESEPRTPKVTEELKKNWSMLLAGLKKTVED